MNFPKEMTGLVWRKIAESEYRRGNSNLNFVMYKLFTKRIESITENDTIPVKSGFQEIRNYISKML